MTLREQLEAKINQVVNNRPQAIQDIFREEPLRPFRK
ncbi:hypothetical protein CYOC110262_23520 [Cytobacillus oceanisediminis]